MPDTTWEDAHVFNDYEIPVNVQVYDTALGTKTYCTISGAFMYDHTYTGQTYHIVICQAV